MNSTVSFFGQHRFWQTSWRQGMRRPDPIPVVKRPYHRPHLEPQPAWRVLTAQVGSFPTRLPNIAEPGEPR
jgi:hypothetical protein